MTNRNWLLLMHQIPTKPEAFRIKIWRALQKSGALQLKNSVYVLPTSSENELKFSAFVEEIVKAGGEAFLCKSQFVLGIDQEEVVAMFKNDRKNKYIELAKEVRVLQKLVPANQRPLENDLMTIEHSLGKLERQMKELKAVDFFPSKTNDHTLKLLNGLISKINQLRNGPATKVIIKKVKDFQGKTWVTRSNIHIDRLASAWLISKFIDKRAKFKFVEENNYKPAKNEVRFDMFNGEFTHIGDCCTFEILSKSFAFNSVAFNTIGEIIHDLDLKDTKYNHPETAGIETLLRGIIINENNDIRKIEKATVLLDNLYSTYDSQSHGKI